MKMTATVITETQAAEMINPIVDALVRSNRIAIDAYKGGKTFVDGVGVMKNGTIVAIFRNKLHGPRVIETYTSNTGNLNVKLTKTIGFLIDTAGTTIDEAVKRYNEELEFLATNRLTGKVNDITLENQIVLNADIHEFM